MRIDLPTAQRLRLLALSWDGSVRIVLRFHLGMADSGGIRPLVAVVREQRRREREMASEKYRTEGWYMTPRADLAETALRQPLPSPGYEPDAADLEAAAAAAWPRALQIAQDRFRALGMRSQPFRASDLASHGTGAPSYVLRGPPDGSLFSSLGRNGPAQGQSNDNVRKA